MPALKTRVGSGPSPTTVLPDPSPTTSEKQTGPHSAHFGVIDTELAEPYAKPGDIELEKGVVRKLDSHVVPLVFVLFLLSFLDRSNIGNAETAGMKEDLDLDIGRYNWLLTIFYISYIVFEFTILAWKVFPPHIWAASVTLAWGVFSSCQAATQNWQGMMALRFLLGVSEAAYGPGIPYLLSFFFLRHELGFRIGIFFSAAPLASTFAGALAYGITSGHASLASWRLLFLVEGIPSICMAPVAYFFLPDTPDKARFLTSEEKRVALQRGVRQAGNEKRIGSLNFGDVGRTLLDPKAWLTALMYFSCNVSYSSLPVFLPTILRDLGFTAINAQGLSAPPYFLSFLLTIGTTWTADKTQQRGFHVILLACMAGIGYIILAVTTNTAARYFAVFLAAAGVFPTIANILPWTLNIQGSDSRRGAGVMLLNLVGQCGPLLGTRIYDDPPNYVKGHAVCAAFMFFVAGLALVLRTFLSWENRRLDTKYGPVDKVPLSKASGSHASQAGQAEENYGPTYRYVL